jgi:hypothetical protein
VSPCCVSAAIKAIQEGLDKVGGRVLVMSASHATVGFGALSRGRERVNLYGTRDEINLYGYANTVINVRIPLVCTHVPSRLMEIQFVCLPAGSVGGRERDRCERDLQRCHCN